MRLATILPTVLSNLFLSLFAAATLATHYVRCDNRTVPLLGARKVFSLGSKLALGGPVVTVKSKARQGSSAANV